MGRRFTAASWLLGALSLALACGGEVTPRSPDSDIAEDGDVQEDGDIAEDGDVHEEPDPLATGSVTLIRRRWLEETGVRPISTVELGAAFFREPLEPSPEEHLVIDETTPDGASCIVRYLPSDEPDGPPPPELTPVDAGTVSASSSTDPVEALFVNFNRSAERYELDARSTGEAMPRWPEDDDLELLFELTGSDEIGPVSHQLTLAAFPAITSPSFTEGAGIAPVEPDSNGDYRLSFGLESPDTHARVHLNSELEGGNTVFICTLQAGETELLLPGAWIQEWTNGAAFLSVIAYHEAELAEGGLHLYLSTESRLQLPVSFE